MSKKIEIERKFLIKFPTSWFTLSEMFDQLVDVKRIFQTYLEPNGNGPSARVRKTVEGLTGDTKTVFHYNKKKPVDSGVHEEYEVEISKSKYENYLQAANKKKSPVEKTRFVFKFNDQVFELDVFKGALKGLAILEIELENKNDKVQLPSYLDVIKEVTDNEKFTNFALADKKYHED